MQHCLDLDICSRTPFKKIPSNSAAQMKVDQLSSAACMLQHLSAYLNQAWHCLSTFATGYRLPQFLPYFILVQTTRDPSQHNGLLFSALRNRLVPVVLGSLQRTTRYLELSPAFPTLLYPTHPYLTQPFTTLPYFILQFPIQPYITINYCILPFPPYSTLPHLLILAMNEWMNPTPTLQCPPYDYVTSVWLDEIYCRR